MFEQLRVKFGPTLGRNSTSAEASQRARRDRKPAVESLEGRVLCDADQLQNGSGSVATITFTGGS